MSGDSRYELDAADSRGHEESLEVVPDWVDEGPRVWSWMTEEGGGFAAIQIPMRGLLAVEGKDYMANSEESEKPIWGRPSLSQIIRPVTLWRIEPYQC
jgi:hypothetical protein